MKKGTFTLYIKNDRNEITKLRDFAEKKEAVDFANSLKYLYLEAGMKNGELFIKYLPKDIKVESIPVVKE